MFSKNSPVTKNFIIMLIITSSALFFLYLCRAILFPFIISVFLAYLFSPLVNKIMLFGLKRWVAVVILTLIFAAVVAVTVIKIAPIIYGEINVLADNFPSYSEKVKDFTSSLSVKISGYVPVDNQNYIVEKIKEQSGEIAAKAVNEVTYLVKKLFSFIYVIVFLPVLTFFMLLEFDNIKKFIIDIVPAKYTETVISVYYEASSVLSKYIRGQIIEVIFVGTLTVAGLSILGVNYAFIIGIIAGLFNLVPYLGPLSGLIMGVTVTAIQFQSLAMVLKVVILFFIIQQTDNHIIQPVVIGKTVNLSPVAMIFALVAGAEIFGILGMIFAVPVVALIKNLILIFIKRYKRTGAYGKSC